MKLTLVLAELLWPQGETSAAAGRATPALCTLLGRGARERREALSSEATLCELLGQDRHTAAAALRAAGENEEVADNALICSDPVHLRFHQDHLILADAANFGIARDEADALVATLNRELAGSGEFIVASAERWYLRLADASDAAHLDTPPLSQVAGRSIERLLAEGAAGKKLRALLNEAQMLLHAHPVNEARERAGLLPINGLWLWGSGTPPARVDGDFDGLWSENALARGLARHAGVPGHALPAGADELLEHVAPGTAHLVVVDELVAPVHYENAEDYRQALAALEARWFAPLQSALARGGVERLRIVAPTAYGVIDWAIRPSDRWKLWRLPRSLGEIASEVMQA